MQFLKQYEIQLNHSDTTRTNFTFVNKIFKIHICHFPSCDLHGQLRLVKSPNQSKTAKETHFLMAEKLGITNVEGQKMQNDVNKEFRADEVKHKRNYLSFFSAC